MQSGAANKVEAAEIKKMQEQLEQLELTGKEIKELFDATVYGQQINFYYTENSFDPSQYKRRRHWPYTSNQNNSLLVSRRPLRGHLRQTCSLF
ncbi:hypothetical protein WR25_14344 [Diploscapter pachys]|uniref:Uncharacterized protein n=1 Tax=Diploscapter pachys TaxID=2018661 RepID=A0A2A2KA86_9BILA|nr:hypothetical protein WR25_14344 [Diploscapter pachys]